jgi:hypothetical protein
MLGAMAITELSDDLMSAHASQHFERDGAT